VTGGPPPPSPRPLHLSTPPNLFDVGTRRSRVQGWDGAGQAQRSWQPCFPSLSPPCAARRRIRPGREVERRGGTSDVTGGRPPPFPRPPAPVDASPLFDVGMIGSRAQGPGGAGRCPAELATDPLPSPPCASRRRTGPGSGWSDGKGPPMRLEAPPALSPRLLHLSTTSSMTKGSRRCSMPTPTAAALRDGSASRQPRSSARKRPPGDPRPRLASMYARETRQERPTRRPTRPSTPSAPCQRLYSEETTRHPPRGQ
jgi:hypothetical protein